MDPKFFLPFAVATAVSFLTTPAVILVLKKLQILDDPKKHKHAKITHTYPVPRGGGIPIFLSLLTAFFFSSSGQTSSRNFTQCWDCSFGRYSRRQI